MLYGSFYAPRYTRKLRTLVDQWQSAPSDTRPEQVRQQAGFFGRGNPLMHLLVNTMSACQTNPNTPAVRETAVRDAQGALEPFEAPLKIIEVIRSEEHTSELQSRPHLVCRLLLEKKKKTK